MVFPGLLQFLAFSYISQLRNLDISGWAFGAVVKMLLGTPTSHVRVPEFKSQLYFRFSFLLM